jgi:hypothetical protein
MFISGYIPVFKQLIDAFDAVIQFFHDSVGSAGACRSSR